MKTREMIKAAALEIGYQKKSGNISVAAGISFEAETSTVTALVGANGIGKSTLLRTLSGIQKPLSGTVEIGGKTLFKDRVNLSKELAVVLTDKIPSANLTVIELIALGRQPYTNWIGTLSKADRSIISYSLEATNTQELRDRKIFEISDGQLQRVMIARAVAQDTPLIILDEPTTHLDLEHKFSLMSLLRDLASDSRKCILFSTHDIELALQSCDKMLIMTNSGFASGTPASLIDSGELSRLFDNQNIEFDREKVKFVFKAFTR